VTYDGGWGRPKTTRIFMRWPERLVATKRSLGLFSHVNVDIGNIGEKLLKIKKTRGSAK